MSEEQLKELQEYNLEYLEAQQSEEIFGGDYTSAVELKYAKKEIERLNNIITKAIEAINVYQNEKTLSVRYQDLNRIRGILRGNEFDLKLFEEYLQELKGSDEDIKQN